jgi:hypothetical protein
MIARRHPLSDPHCLNINATGGAKNIQVLLAVSTLYIGSLDVPFSPGLLPLTVYTTLLSFHSFASSFTELLNIFSPSLLIQRYLRNAVSRIRMFLRHLERSSSTSHPVDNDVPKMRSTFKVNSAFHGLSILDPCFASCSSFCCPHEHYYR